MDFRAWAACLAATACLTGGIAPAAAPTPKAREHFVEGRWRVAIRRDRFTGEVRCTLGDRRDRVRYLPGALGFVFRHGLVTLDAVYRVDDGAPRRWADAYPALIAAGIAVDGPGLDNPTDGVVWIPIAELANVRHVWIRPNTRHPPTKFIMEGLAAVLLRARTRGCEPDATFGP